VLGPVRVVGELAAAGPVRLAVAGLVAVLAALAAAAWSRCCPCSARSATCPWSGPVGPAWSTVLPAVGPAAPRSWRARSAWSRSGPFTQQRRSPSWRRWGPRSLDALRQHDAGADLS